MGKRARIVTAVLVLAGALLAVGHADIVSAAPLSNLQRVLAASGNRSNGDVVGITISNDGRYILFSSTAADLVSGDTNNLRDLFLKDTVTGFIVRVNVSNSGEQAAGGESFVGNISDNNRYVVFISNATNLVPDDTNGHPDIFVRDLATGQTMRANTTSTGQQANGYANIPYISGDGTIVTFQSDATNLVSGATGQQIYAKNMVTGEVTLVSRDLAGNPVASVGTLVLGGMSCDGQKVVFRSRNANLTPGSTGNLVHVFTQSTFGGAASRANITANGNADSHTPYISCDGSRVVYYSRATNLTADRVSGSGAVFAYDTHSAATQLVSVNGNSVPADAEVYPHAISGNGRFVAMITNSYAGNLIPQGVYSGWALVLFVRDLEAHRTDLAAVYHNYPQAAGGMTGAGISRDGSRVAFISNDYHILPGPDTPIREVYWGNYLVQQIDYVPPMVTYSMSRQPDANGWYDHDVTINWTATDPAPSSGAATQPAPTLAFIEGEHTYTSGPSCDPSGNCSTGNATVKLDKSPPTINYSLSQQPNANGWNNSQVTVTFNCSDPSGIQDCTQPVTVSADGETTVTGTATDKAGKATSITVPVKVDTTSPTITFTAVSNGWVRNGTEVAYQCLNEDGTTIDLTAPIVVGPDGQSSATGTCTDVAGNTTTQTIPVRVDTAEPSVDFQLSQPTNNVGWSTGPVTVTFQCSDPANNGQAVSGIEQCSDPVTVAAEGTTVVTGTARDHAGNVTEVNVFVNVDSIKPTLNYVVSPDAPVSGWFASDVTVTFTCSDATSGVASCPQPVTVSADGAQVITAKAVDVAGNEQSVSVSVSLDKTAPTIAYVLSPAPSAQGWSSSPVTVSFICEDSASGIAACTPPQIISSDGAYIVTGSATDNAGHTTSINVTVGVDSALPTITATLSSAGPTNGWYNTAVTTAFSCTDALSGILTCTDPVTLSAEGANQPYAGAATDNAGNGAMVNGMVNIDKTAPAFGTPVWSQNPKPVSGTATLTVPYTESLSGIQAAEYFLGDVDPGLGNGATMSVQGDSVSATFGTDFATGVYKVTVRAKDYAGNWSVAVTDYLVVYNPNGFRLTGKSSKGNLIPSLANGDVLPNLVAGSTVAANFGFNVRYGADGAIDPTSDMQFDYNTGTKCNSPSQAQGCHMFEMNAATVAWMATTGANDNTGVFQGVATLNIDGVTSQVIFRVTGIDGERLAGDQNAPDSFTLSIYPAGSDPNVVPPQYKVSGTGLSKQSVKIH